MDKIRNLSMNEFWARRREILGDLRFKHPIEREQLDELTQLLDRATEIQSLNGTAAHQCGFQDGLSFAKTILTCSCEFQP